MKLSECIALGLIGLCFANEARATQPASGNSASPSTNATVAMQPIRRVGIQPVSTNLSSFRNFMRKDPRFLGGFPALPYTENEASDELTKLMSRTVRDSGRFWSLSIDVTTDLLRRDAGTVEMSASLARLEKRYDLDGWLLTDVQFQPDHTRVRVALKSSRGDGIILAREDLTIGSSPSSLDIDTAIHSAVAKLQNTLGHDGRITWSRENLVVVDFGKERGVVAGSRFEAGYVLLSSMHPATREFFRSKRLKLMDLVVVEARSGSSLCRVVSRDRVAVDEIKTLAPELSQRDTVLVWRADSTPSQAAKEPPPVVLQTSGAASGFGKGEIKPVEVVAAAPQASEPVRSEMMAAAPVSSAPVSNSEYDEEDLDSTSEKVVWSEPSSWKIEGVNAGGGIVFAGLKGSAASSSTGFPYSILNAVRAEAVAHIDRDLVLAPGAAVQFFASGETTGYRLDAELPLLFDAIKGSARSLSNHLLQVGGGLALTAGSVDAEVDKGDTIVNLSQEFLSIDAIFVAQYRGAIPDFGTATIGAGLSFIELATDEGPGLELRLGARPEKIAPKELSLYSRLRLGPGIWSSTEFGAQWLIW